MIRVFRHYIPSWVVLLCLVEAALLFAAVYFGAAIRLGAFNPSDKLIVGALWPRALFWSFTMCVLLIGVGLYQPDLRDDLRGIWLRLLVALLIGALAAATALAIAPGWSVAPGGLSMIVAASLVAVGGTRSLLHICAESKFSRRRILVLGAGEAACEVERLRRKADWRGLSLLGFVQMQGESVCVSSRPVYLHDSHLADMCARMKVDELVVAIDEERIKVPVNQVLDCKVRGIQVTDLIGFFEQRTGKIMVDSLKPSQVIFADGFVQAALKSTIHRVFDITVSLAMLIALSWLMLLTAVLIRLESKRGEKILYRQIRVGRDNQPFQILKFRSMTSDAEKDGAQWARPGDARITRVGSIIRKTRIDELPQLVNVIRGEMSFVGPRPERPEFVEKLAQGIPYYNLRHRVNPGITGWAQICYPYGASEADAKEKLQFDLYYIKNYSLFLDIMILLQTVQVILWGKGAR